MADGKGTNVASVGLSLDSSAFNSGVARALADISRLLTGLRELQAASQKTNLGQLGAGRASAGAAFTPAGFARDIQRLAIPAIRQLDRTASSSVVFGGRAARTGGFDPVAMTQAINRQLIPAMQRMGRLADSSASGDWMKNLMAQSNAQRAAMRRFTEEESRRAQQYAEGEAKRQERAAQRALQAIQAQNRAGTDPLTTRSRAMRARMEEERYIRETGAFRKAHPTPIGTGFPGRGGGSMEGRWGDVSDLRGMPKDWIKVLKQLESQGWNIGKGNAGHGYAKPIDKNYKPITFGTTPSDFRALQNFISIARRAGGIINGRGRTLGDEAFVSNRQPGMYQDPRTGSFTLGAKYAMTSLERMIASTEAERGYPQVMQPRPRGSQGQLSASTREQIASMTRKFEKELIFKPTTNLEEGLIATVGSQAGKEFVLSGSGRTLGMRNILKEHGSAGKAVLSNAVNEYLKNNPGEFGKGEAAALRKQAAALFAAGETPMIVRRLNTPLESMSPKEQGQLGLQLNARTGLTTEEIAHSAARLMGPLPAGLLAGDPRKVIAAGKGEAYSAFKQQLVEEALGSTLATKRFGKGTEMTNLMMQTLVARAYGNNTATAEMLTSAYGKEPSALGTTTRAALERNLGNQLRLRSRIESGELPAGMDPVFNALPGALKLMQEATTGPQAWISGKQKEGLVGNQLGAVRALLSQKTMFGGKIPREALRLASAMLSVPSGGLGAFLSTITAYGAKAEGAQASLFGEEGGAMKADPRQAVQMSIRAANEYLAQAKNIKGKGKEASAARTALFNSVLENVFSGMAPAAPMAAPMAAPAAAPAAPAPAPAKPKSKRFTFRLTEEEEQAFLRKLRGPATFGAGGSEGSMMFPSEEQAARSNEFRRPNAYRLTEQGGYGINPRAIGTARGSVKALAGGYLPYEEALKSNPGLAQKQNNFLTRGIATLAYELEEFLSGKAKFNSTAAAAKRGELQKLVEIANARGIGYDPTKSIPALMENLRTALSEGRVEAVAAAQAEAARGQKNLERQRQQAAENQAKAAGEAAARVVASGGQGGGGGGRRPTATPAPGGENPLNPYLAAVGGKAKEAAARSAYNLSVAGLNARTGKYLVDPNEQVLNMQKVLELRNQMKALTSAPEFAGLSVREQARQISLLAEKMGPVRALQGAKLANVQLGVQGAEGGAAMQSFARLLTPFLETYLPGRRMTSMALAESRVPGMPFGQYSPSENSMLLTGLRERSSGAALRTLIHELSHGQFETRMRQGYRNPAEVPVMTSTGQIARNAQGNIQYMPHAVGAARYGEPMSAGHLDPEFYRLQAATSKSSGALTAQLAFHRLMGEAVPGGFENTRMMEQFGVGKEAARLLPELQKLASPEQTKVAGNYIETMRSIYEALGSSNFKGLGKLQRFAARIVGSAIGQGLIPEKGGLQAAAGIGNFLAGLNEQSFGKNLPKTKMEFLKVAAEGTTGLIGPESQLARPMEELSRARSQVAQYIRGLTPLQKGMLAMGMDPSAFQKSPGEKPFFDPKNAEHVAKANQMLRNLVRSFQEASKAPIPAAETLQTQGRVSQGQGRGTRQLPMHLENVPHTSLPGGGGVVLQGTRGGAFTGGGALVPYDPLTAAESMRRYYAQTLMEKGGLTGRFFRGVGMERLMMPQEQIREGMAEFRNTLGSRIYNSPLGAPLSQFRAARETYATQGMDQSQLRSQAKVDYQKQLQATDAMAHAQTRLNRVLGTGNINFNQLGKVMSEVGNGFTAGALSSLRFAANLAIGQQAVFAFVGMINHLRGGIIEFNAKLEAAAVGFRTLFINAGYSVSEAEQKTSGFIQTLREFANVTNFRFGDLQTAALRMKAFGFEIDNATAAAKNQMPILEAIPNPWVELTGGAKQFRGAIVNIGDAVAALGAEDDKLRRVTYALGQMNSAGRVYQNDMMQLANAGIAGYDILAKAVRVQLENDPELMKANKAIYGKLLNPRTAVEEIRKLARVGRLVGPEAVQAILKGLGQQYGGGMQAFSRTFQGAMTTLADTSQSLIATAFKPMFDMVRDFTVQLADAFQTTEWTSKAENFAKVIGDVADALKGFIPGAAKTGMEIISSFFNTLGKLGSAAGNTNSVLGSLTSNFAKGLATIGDLLRNDVIRNLLVAGVTAKLVLSTIASNPLLATIGLIVTSIGTISQAVKSNAFGFGDLYAEVRPQFDRILDNIGANFVPGIVDGLKGGIEAFVALMGSFIRSVTPIFMIVLDIISKVGAAVKPFANVLGMALAAFVTKKVLVDGMAAAMGRFANATQAAGAAMAKMAGGRLGFGSQMGMGAFGAERRFYSANRMVGVGMTQFDPMMAALTGQSGVMNAVRGQAGMGYSSPELIKAARFLLPRAAEEAGVGFGGANLLRRGAALTPEAAGMVLGQYQGIMQRRNTPEGEREYKQMKRAIGKRGMDLLAEQSAIAQQGVIASLGQFAMKLKSTGLSLETLKTIAKALGARLAGMGTAVMGIGMFASAIGGLVKNESLQKVGDTMTTLGFAVSGLAMGFNALKAAFPAMTGGMFAIILAITALVSFLMDQQVTEADRKKAGTVRETYAAREKLIAAYGEDYTKKMYPELFPEGGVPELPDESKNKPQTIPEYYKRFGVTQEILNNAMGDTTKATLEAGKWLEGVDPSVINRAIAESELVTNIGEFATSLFKQGYKPEEIAQMTGMTLDDVKAKFKKFYESTGSDGKELVAQVLSESMDATGAALKEAQEAYQKALEPFQTALGRLTSRTQEVMQEMFDAEKKALENEKQAALDNTIVMYNGEQVRLGVLEQQYDAMKAQREEMDRMAELEKQRTAAAEAALNVFDATVAPLERARQAREAARDLFNQVGANRLNEMQRAIDAGKSGVGYTETTSYYEDRAKALQKDQAERMRTVQEQLDDLMKQIAEGKIGTTAAKAKFKDIFAQAGLDLDVASQQGYQFMSAFGDGFMDSMNKNITSVFSKLPGLILKAMEVAKQDALYKKAQDFYNDIVNPQSKITGKEYKEKYVSKMLESAKKMQQYGRAYLTTGAGRNLFADPKERDAFLAKITEKVVNLQNVMTNVADDAVITGSLVKATDSGFRSFFSSMLQLPSGDQLLAVLSGIYGMRGEGMSGINFMPSYTIPGGAQGGTFGAGPFMVGERGPEMVVPTKGGLSVIPNHALPYSLRSSAGALGGAMFGIPGYAAGTPSPWDDILKGTPMVASASGVKRAGSLSDYAMMIAATLAPELIGSRALISGIGRVGGGILDAAGTFGTKTIEPLINSRMMTGFEKWWLGLGKPGSYQPGPVVKTLSAVMAPQLKLMQMADAGGLQAILAASGFLGLTAAEAMAPGMIMDFLSGTPKRMTPPSTPHAPSRGSVSGVVNIHNPQLNSAADIDRLADAVAKAQARALRSSGYVRK